MSGSDHEQNRSAAVWQAQHLETPRISMDFVRHQAEKLNSAWRVEMRVMVLGIVLTIIVLATALALRPSPALHVTKIAELVWSVRAGSFLLVAGAVYLWFDMRRRGQLLTLSRNEGVVPTLETYRSELRRRRDYYLGAWRWSFWPVIPAGVVILGGAGLYDQRPGRWLRILVLAALLVAGLALVALHNHGKGRRYQRELDALASLDSN
jgi:MFS family permease